MDILQEIEQEASKASVDQIPDNASLDTLTQLAEQQIKLTDAIARSEEMVRDLKKQFREVTEKKIPDMMTELQLKEIVLTDGSKLSVKTFVSASISQEKKGEAYQWLEENGYGDLIKHTISVSVGRDQEAAVNAYKALTELGMKPMDQEKVEPQTLKAFIKGQVEKGEACPLELFGAYLGQKSTITRRK